MTRHMAWGEDLRKITQTQECQISVWLSNISDLMRIKDLMRPRCGFKKDKEM